MVIDEINKEAETQATKLMEAIVKIGTQLAEENSNVDEILKRKVKKFGNSGHIAVPGKYIGRSTILKILKKRRKNLNRFIYK